MEQLKLTAIAKLAAIAEEGTAVTLSIGEAEFLQIGTWDTSETVGEGGQDE